MMATPTQSGSPAPIADPQHAGGAIGALVPLQPFPPWRRWALALGIAAIAAATYWNTLESEFVTWDDEDYVYKNKLVKSDDGLSAIWTDFLGDKPHEQFYPLVFTTFWIEHQLVGLDPWLYHLTQLILHALNASLVMFVMRWLGVGVFPAVFAALVFAVHPINVASVAWVTERKNTLSGFFFFLSLLQYIQHRRCGGSWRYVGAILAFQLALFSKTATLILAPILIVTDRVLDGRWTRSSLLRSIPFFVLGLILLPITVRIENIQGGNQYPVDFLLRPLIAAASLVHYVIKLVVPVNLLPIYPRWPESFTEPRYWWSLAACVASTFLIWRYRLRLGSFILWGLAVFVLAALPVLGFKHFNYQQFSFVADHFIYLSGPGFFLAVGVMLDRMRYRSAPTPPGEGVCDRPEARQISRWRNALTALLSCTILATFCWGTIRLNLVWRDGVSLWQYELAGYPDCHPGHFNLGNHYYKKKDYETALQHYLEAVRIKPHFTTPYTYAAHCYWHMQRTDEALELFKAAAEVEERKFRKLFDVRLEYATRLVTARRLEEALSVCDAILAAQPTKAKLVDGVRRLRRRILFGTPR